MEPNSRNPEPAAPLEPGRIQHRVFPIAARAEHRAVDEEKRTVELSFSSEEPYGRWWGIEILDHAPQSVRLERLAAAGPLLVEHNPGDIVGTIERAWIAADRRGRALVRFGRSARAEEVFRDVVDGIRRSVSIGYVVHRYEQQTDVEGPPVFVARDWEPLEVSLVAVPADANVGVAKSKPAAEAAAPPKERIPKMSEVEITREETQKRLEQTLSEARRAEQNRVREIYAYVRHWPQAKLEPEAEKAVREGTPIEEFRETVFRKLEALGAVRPVSESPEIGLSGREAQSFSVLRAIRALAARGTPDEQKFLEEAKFEFECSRALAARIKREPRGFFVPHEALRRDLVVGTPTAGGNLVGTDFLAGNFIEMLRNQLVVRRAGATLLEGLVGHVAIPKQTGAATGYWVAENSAPTESAPTFGQLTLTPKTFGAFVDISRRLLLQSTPSAEYLVRADLAQVIARGIDLACLHGSGQNNQPTGIASTTGIGSVVGGTNGAAPTWEHLVGLETAVAAANADVGTLAYVTNTKVRGKLKTTFTNATYGERPVWTNGPERGVGEVNGYAAYASNQVSSSLVKGTANNCSAIFFGNWADLVIGFWSGIDIMVDPYSLSTTGAVRVTAFQDLDLGVRHAESFAAMLDALA